MLFRLTLVYFVVYLFTGSLAANEIKILAIDIYGDSQTSQKWRSTISYLKTNIPKHSFSVVCVKPNQIARIKRLITEKKVDFLITQPAIYVELEITTGISKTLTLIKQKDVDKLESVIFTKKSSNIKTIKNLKNKNISAVAPIGFGGWLIGYDELFNKGIDLHSYANSISFEGSQFSVVDNVLKGKTDAGIIRTGLIERLIKEQRLKLSDINILNQQYNKNFPQIHSSTLYPEWAFAKTPHISNKISKEIASALLSIPAGSSIATKDHYWEWTTPYDYKPVHDLLKKLEIGAYKDYKKITFKKYKYEILFLIATFITIITLLIIIMRRNLTIKQEEKKNLLIQKQLFKAEKLSSMGELLGNIAHQWRQPLSVISTASTGLIIQKENNLLSDKHFLSACNAITENAQYLSLTIDDFSNYIKNGKKKETFNLQENLKHFLYLVEGSTKVNNIDIILEVKDKEFTSYENKLLESFINLFNNSKEKLNELELQEKLIFISADIKDELLIISFKDNANGIDENIIDKIFDPYFTTKHQYFHTGLGLNRTYELIVKDMKGEITIKNTTYNYNKKIYTGAEFTIKLPSIK